MSLTSQGELDILIAGTITTQNEMLDTLGRIIGSGAAVTGKAFGVARLDSDQRSGLRSSFRSAVTDLGRTSDPCLHPPPPGNRITESRET